VELVSEELGLSGGGALGRVGREGRGRGRPARDMDVALLVAQVVRPDPRGDQAPGGGLWGGKGDRGRPFCGQDR
jgi:hypothetical protein